MTFYGNVKYQLLNGFSQLKVQEQAWDFDNDGNPIMVDGSQPIYNNLNLVFTFKNRGTYDTLMISSGLLESSYDPDSFLGNIYPIGTISEIPGLGTVSEIGFKHDIYYSNKTLHSVQHDRIQFTWASFPAIDETIPNNFSSPKIINSKYDENKNHYFYLDEDGEEVLFNFKALDFDNNFLIDQQGHCLIDEPFICSYNTQRTNLDAQYEHDNWVDLLAIGNTIQPELITEQLIDNINEELKSLNSTAIKNEDNKYNIEIGNCADLYNNIGTIYQILNEKKDLGINFFQELKDNYIEINELINNQILIIKNNNDFTDNLTNLYWHNISYPFLLNDDRLISTESFQNININNLSSFNFILQNDLDLILPKYLKTINYFFDSDIKTSIFLSAIDGLKKDNINIDYFKNSVLKKKLEQLKDFYNLMNILFYNYQTFEEQQQNIFNGIETSEEVFQWNIEDSLFIKWVTRMRYKYYLDPSE